MSWGEVVVIMIFAFYLANIRSRQEDIMDILKEIRDIDNQNNK